MTKKNKKQNKSAGQKAINDFEKMVASQPSAEELFEKQFAPFADIVRDYEQLPAIASVAEAAKLNELAAALCPNGKLALSWSGGIIPWRKGLASLCSPELSGGLGQAAREHLDAMTALYSRWSDLEGGPWLEKMHQTAKRDTLEKLLDVQLAPGLAIENREDLSEKYVHGVLKPYARAVYHCRQMLWNRIKEGHATGAWFCFQPNQNGSYTILPPGAGFNSQGDYAINRATYLAGFGYDDSEIGTENYQHARPYPGQDGWMFVSVKDVLALRVPKQKRGRKKGSGIDDSYYVNKGLQMIDDGTVTNPNAAAKLVIDHHDELLKHSTYDSVRERIRKKIQEKLNLRSESSN